jgi:hypothetical protein
MMLDVERRNEFVMACGMICLALALLGVVVALFGVLFMYTIGAQYVTYIYIGIVLFVIGVVVMPTFTIGD